MYYKILARIIGIFEQKRVKAWAFLGAFLIALSFFWVFKPYMGPLSPVNLQLSWGINFKPVAVINTENQVTSSSLDSGEITKAKKLESSLAPICNFTGKRSDFCEINGDIRIHGNGSSIYFTTPHPSMMPENGTLGIKLYARKNDRNVMGKVKEHKLKLASSQQGMPECTVNYTVPAIVFSARGYTGNYFHDISDVMIPLYLTSLQFNGEVQFLLELKNMGWVEKYKSMFKALSNYEIIDLTHDTEIRCFKNAVVGLKAHTDFGIDPQMSPFGYTLRNFTQFIRRTYSLERETAIRLKGKNDYRKPRLLIIARKKTRTFLNEDEIAAEAQSLGYDVGIVDARINLKDFSKIVNSLDVMIGVHGAGLTNMIFLPEKAVLIQVIPLELEGVARTFYERPARNMNLRYLPYKISKNESSLIEQFPTDHPVFIEPGLFKKQGWLKFKSVYMDNQNVRVDVNRFRNVLLEALELLRQ